MKKSDIVIDLIARAFGLKIPEDLPRLKDYCELFSTAKTMDVLDECMIGALVGDEEPKLFELKREDSGCMAPAPKPEPDCEAEVEPSEPEPPSVMEDDPNPSEPTPPTPPAPPEDKQGAFFGKGANEKRTILARLEAYKEKNGVGCLNALADASKGKLSTSTIRDMLGRGKHALPEWIALGRALDKVVVA